MDAPRSLTGKRWTHRDDGSTITDPAALIALLRALRGLDEPVAHAYDPALFPDAAKAAERIERATRDNETIGLFGDYDCDGVTSCAQIIRALRRRGADPIVRLPHRVHDGYGLKPDHVDEFAAAGATLLITVDTGISAGPAIDRARALGIDTIVMDHHRVMEPPQAYAILHPALAPHFPGAHPSAAGVVFLFLHALEGPSWKDRDVDLALATFGTVADLVPLKGINRRLVQDGLEALTRLPAGPVRAFVELAATGKPLTSIDVAFRIAPRINAAGRMADPLLALKALLEGGDLLKDLDTLNALRREETDRMLERATAELPLDANGEPPAFLSIASASYAHGILGLLAGKLTERTGRPSMAVHIEGELCTASFRSPAIFNVTEALERNKELLLTFGGHAQAAGATFSLNDYIALADALEREAETLIPPEALTPSLTIDAAIDPAAITVDFCAALSSLEPFGQGNPEPTFLLRDVRLTDARRVGSDGRHLQATAGACKAIGFGLGDLLDETNESLDLACRVGIDAWNGRVRPQLFIQDMRTAVKILNSKVLNSRV